MQSPLQVYASHICVLDLKSLITHGDPKNADLLRTANVLGAVALGVVDALRAGSRAIMGYDGAAAAALSMIGHKPSLSVLHLSQVLEMSHPGTVRLVDNLVSDGLVERRRSARDARTVELRLTVLGEERRKAVAASREAAILATLSVLSADETRQLGMLLGRLLQSMPKSDVHGDTICRLCDEVRCDQCPVEAAQSRFRALAPGHSLENKAGD